MRNLFNIIVYGFILFLFSCNPDDANFQDGNVKIRSNCITTISYDEKITKYVSFLPNNDNLTVEEKAMTLPSYEYLEYNICKKGNGELSGEILCIPEKAVHLALKEHTLGDKDHIKWRSEFNNGSVIVYDEDNKVIESQPTNITSLNAEGIEKFSKMDLLSKDQYKIVMDEMKKNLPIVELSSGDYLLKINNPDGTRTEVIYSSIFQREAIFTHFDGNNDIVYRRFYNYSVEKDPDISIASNGTLKFHSEYFQVFKKSPFSNKTIVVNKVTDFKNITTN